MKKKILIGILLLVVCFWNFNVKAEGLPTNITGDEEITEVAEAIEEENTEEEDEEEEVSSDGNDGNVLEEENIQNPNKEDNEETEKTEEKNIELNNDAETNNELTQTTDTANEDVEENNDEENYKVTFTHSGYELSIPGGSSILLSQLNTKLGINISLSEVVEISISNEEVLKLIKVENSNDYNIQSLKSFNTEEELIIRTTSGDEYIIKVVDPVGDTPDHGKELIDNNDGTYTLALTVVGDAENKVQKVNVVIVLDTSGSMDFAAGDDTYVQNNQGGYGIVNGEYDFLYYRTGGGFGGYQYHRIADGTHSGTVYYIDNNGYAQQYNGTRYTTSKTRMDAAQEAVNSLAQALLSHNGNGNPNDTVQLALVQFNTTASTVGSVTTNYTTFSNSVSGLSANGGTNWEAALYRANLVNFNDNDQTYVIFVSDGNPTYYGTGNSQSGTGQETANNIQASYNAAVNDAQTLVNNGKKFYTIGAYGNVDRMENLTIAANGNANNYYSAANTQALQDALNAIYQAIEMEGIGSVSISDGTTNQVTTSSGVSNLLDVDTGSFKYYKDNVEWTSAPEATLTDNGEVVWDLSGVGVLENGVTYKVTFVVWPSQTTLDLIADLKNYPDKYDTLDENIKRYLVKDGDGYTLKTNTTASLSFKDTREENPQTHTETYTNPDPVSTSATQMLTISKKWSNGIDEREKREITIDVLRDGESWRHDLVLNDGNNYEESTNIAVGIMTVKNGEVEIKAKGHDFSFGELGDEAYNWELKSQVVHPMLINGELTILIRQGTEVPAEGTYYKIGNYYYTVGTLTTQGVAELIATNERRSWIDLTKEVNYDDNAAHFDDELFEFEITVDNKEEKVWFSVKVSNDTNAAFATTADGLVVTGATAEDGNTGYYYAVSNNPFTVKMKAGWNLRIINLLTGSTYTIAEKNIDSKFEFEDITYTPTTDIEGNDYEPDVDEDSYSVSGEIQKTNTKYGYTFINKNVNTEIVVIKVWEDNNDVNKNRPSNIVLNLSDGTKVIAQPTKVENEDGTWTYTYTGLAVYDGNGKLIEYKLTEDAVTGYTTEITGNAKEGFTVTNTLETISVTVNKDWQDNNNQDGIRPGTITLTLSNGDTVELTKEGNWTATVNNLPKYKNGSLVTYTVTEENVPEGYNVTYSEDGLTAINTHTPDTKKLVVKKVWDDSSNKEGLRPTEITIRLLANGEEVEVTPTIEKNGNTWTFTYSKLDVYAGGTEIEYTVTEDTVTNYKTDIDNEKLIITNSRTVETIKLTVKKVWDDNDNQDGKRPEKLTVTLNDADKTEKELNADNEWTVTITVQKYIDGEIFEYAWTEEDVDDYKLTDTKVQDNVTTFTNTHTPETKDVEVKKIWNDESNKEGFRPDEITVELLANGEKVAEATFGGEGNEWTHTFEDLDVYANGKEIKYTVKEIKVDKYETTIDGLTITNSREVETTEITIEKVWEDNDDQDGLRPDKVTVTLSNGDTVEITEKDGWKKTVKDLQKYEDGEEIVYTVVKELVVNGYEVTYSEDTLTITNTHTPETDDAVVTKVWSDESNKEGFRPETITVHLYANGKEVDATPEIKDNGDDTWTITYSGLAVNAGGNKITYTVTEDKVENYKTSIDGLTIKNSRDVETKDVEVKKIWVDKDNKEGFRPEEITVELLANGEKVAEATFGGEGNEWTHTFEDLDVYANGEEIEYTVKEIKVDKYETTIDGLTITNTHEVETVTITIKKIWVDDNDRDGVRPKKIVITIEKSYAESEDTELSEETEKPIEVTLDASNDWTATINGLLMYENGLKLVYTAVEKDVPKGYEVSYSEDTFTITNTHEIDTKDITVTKVWDDSDNESEKRPESVTVILLANGKEYDRIELSETNNWTHPFEGVPVNDEDHKEITYSVTEEDVPEGYEVAYEETEDGFIVHNALGQGDGEPPENPQTGSNIVLYLIALLISIIGLVSGKLYLKENN